jgi:hypothetical protein
MNLIKESKEDTLQKKEKEEIKIKFKNKLMDIGPKTFYNLEKPIIFNTS